jgi:hypothetical protein
LLVQAFILLSKRIKQLEHVAPKHEMQDLSFALVSGTVQVRELLTPFIALRYFFFLELVNTSLNSIPRACKYCISSKHETIIASTALFTKCCAYSLLSLSERTFTARMESAIRQAKGR